RALSRLPADAVVYTGFGGPSGERLLRAVAAAIPGARVYGSSGLLAGRGDTGGVAVGVLEPVLPASSYGRRARAVLGRLGAERGAPRIRARGAGRDDVGAQREHRPLAPRRRPPGATPHPAPLHRRLPRTRRRPRGDAPRPAPDPQGGRARARLRGGGGA